MDRLWRFLLGYGLDALIVIVAAGGAVEVALREDPLQAPTSSLAFAVPAVALVVLPLLWRRRFPFAAPAAVWVLAAATSFADGRLITFAASIFLAGLVAAFLLGNLRDAVQSRVGLALVIGGAAIVVFNDPTSEAGDFVFTPLLFAIAWLAGFAMRERAERATAAEARAAAAEREREVAARVAVAEERARIARELHDIVAHAVSVMVLQAGAVRHRLPEALGAGAEGIEGVAEGLEGVERTGRTALAEMRRLLGAMRREDEEVELGPQPGLGDLEALIEEVGRAGLAVRLRVEGERRPLPHGLDVSAYRIVQEGLTNALKHARASEAEVTVRYGARELGIEVRDDGAGVPAAGAGNGHGLVGIRERVKIYGGEMSAGALDGGGFVLATRLPVRGEDQ